MILASLFDWRAIRDSPYVILLLYVLNFISLSLLLFLGSNTRGAQGWYRLGPFSLDPIEPLKIILLLMLAKYFSLRHIEMYNIKHILISGLYVLAPSFLIFLQPDLGSVLILIFLWISVLIASGIEIRHFVILTLVFVILFSFSWDRFLRDYQKERIISFLMPHFEPLGIGWSQQQSETAIGSGGFWGRGWKMGSQVQLGFLTAPQTDFIFSAIGEEFGFLGVLFLFFLISTLFWRIMKIAFLAKTNFERLFALGFGALFVLQVFVNVGMNLGLLPVIGISLTFVSYGGSSLISNLVALGILQNIKIYS